jgi:hypothetical protein
MKKFKKPTEDEEEKKRKELLKAWQEQTTK